MSNLLEKASILLTPTAYDDGKILSVKPAPSLGSELVVNGGFNTDSDWTKGAGWSISNGAATKSGTDLSYLTQSSLTSVAGKTYRVKASITNVTTGNIRIDNFTSGNTYTSDTEIDVIFTATSAGAFRFLGWAGFDGSIDNVSVKELIDGDFDFTRNSSATRVNSQGLIEDVQILSSNLVSNGDFSQEGSELITNGDFANNIDGWISYSSTSAWDNGTIKTTATSNAAWIRQNSAVTSNKSYKVTFKAKSSNISPNIKIYNGATFLDTGLSFDAIDTYKEFTYYLYTTASNIIIGQQGLSVGDTINFDNVSVKEVGQDWNLGTGWSIGTNKAIANNVPNLQRLQRAGNNPSVIGNTYKYSINISNVSGFYSVYIFGVYVLATSNTEGIIEGEFTATSTNGAFWVAGASASGLISATIENITILEITEDTNLPRIDYTDGVGHILLEPQSTNLIIQSEALSTINLQATITDNNLISPTGDINASLVVENTATNSHGISKTTIVPTNPSSTTYTLSIFAKKKERQYIQFGFYADGVALNSSGFDLENGTTLGNASTHKIVNFGNGWYRCSFTANVTQSTGGYNFARVLVGATVNSFFYAGDGASGLYMFGFDLEQQSFATSYIPTSGSTVTRLGETLNNAGSSDLINSTEGVLYAEIAALANDNTNRQISLNNGTTNDRIQLYFSTSTNQITVFYKAQAGTTSFIFNETLGNATSFNKIAFKWKTNDFALWVNGVETDTLSSGVTPLSNVLNNLDFNQFNGSNLFYGKTKCVAVFKEALTDAELTCLTTI